MNYTHGDLDLRIRRSSMSAAHDTTGVPTIVLVHGIGVSSRYFDRLVERLRPTAPVIAVDLPGFGRSRRPRRMLSVEDFGAVLSNYLADAGVFSPILVGHSMGAQIVVDAATRHPVAGLVLIGPVVDERARSLGRQALRLVRDTAHESPGANWIVVTDYLRSGIRWYVTELPAMLAYRIERHLPRVDAPVLVIRGENDTVAPDGWIRALARRAVRSRVVSVPNAAHVVQYTAPGAVAEEILRLAATVTVTDAVPESPDACAGGAAPGRQRGAGFSTP